MRLHVAGAVRSAAFRRKCIITLNFGALILSK
jgi:hypothetical protein